jgi:hypothetical protein
MSNEFDGVLRQGDCVKNDIDDVTYHKIAQAFLKAGCPDGEYESHRRWRGSDFCGWDIDRDEAFFHGTRHAFTRELTVDQVLSTLDPNPTQWRGPQDGLPPVGTECEVNENGGYEVEIIAHSKNKAGDVAIYKRFIDGVLSVDFRVAECFRPIQTERDKAIEAAVKIIEETGRMCEEDTAAALYDAGLLRPQREGERSKDDVIESMAAAFRNGCMYDYSGQPFIDGITSIYDAIKSGEVVV